MKCSFAIAHDANKSTKWFFLFQEEQGGHGRDLCFLSLQILRCLRRAHLQSIEKPATWNNMLTFFCCRKRKRGFAKWNWRSILWVVPFGAISINCRIGWWTGSPGAALRWYGDPVKLFSSASSSNQIWQDCFCFCFLQQGRQRILSPKINAR